jgi:hypothetical protein
MPLGQRREAFDHPEWIFELKYDGFRALLSIGVERPEFISRNATRSPGSRTWRCSSTENYMLTRR